MSDFNSERVVKSIEARAAKLKISITEVCRLANIARSTYQRWKRGDSSPSLENLERIDTELKKLER